MYLNYGTRGIQTKSFRTEPTTRCYWMGEGYCYTLALDTYSSTRTSTHHYSTVWLSDANVNKNASNIFIRKTLLCNVPDISCCCSTAVLYMKYYTCEYEYCCTRGYSSTSVRTRASLYRRVFATPTLPPGATSFQLAFNLTPRTLCI